MTSITQDEKNYLPLVDKFKPSKLDNIILPFEIKQKIIKIINRKCINDTIIIGQNGVGKTLLLNLITKQILNEFYEDACLVLNTTNNRGLKDLSVLLPTFCEQYVQNFIGKKIIIIDEADNLTKKAQNLITNIMNDHGKNNVFIFTCNDSTKIISSILSKCVTIYIPPIKKEQIISRLEILCEKEKVFYTQDALEVISEWCKGDIRIAINLLDNIRNGFDTINIENTKLLLYKPSTIVINSFINLCIKKKLFKAINIIVLFKDKGFCGTDILLSIFDYLKISKIEEHICIKYISIIVKFYTRMCEGIDTDLQLYACVSELVLCDITN